jgi:putative phosphoesterase
LIIIALLSDNHSYYGEDIQQHVNDVDEVWHAGDIGDFASIEPLIEKRTFRAVFGNIDDRDIRNRYPHELDFECEGIRVLMTHIGGYPGKYPQHIKERILLHKPNLFICGHSHICKVMYDKSFEMWHMNPGAYGHHGFHKVRTLLKFEIDAGKIQHLRVIELGMRGSLR